MDNVVSRQTHFKRILEKQLGEIEVRQRQSEARRLKQIRDLGVDLSRIQKTSRDLEFSGDYGSRRQRRGSLPTLDGSEAVSFYFESPRAPRMGRRYSCIGSIPLVTPDVQDDHTENASPEADLSFPNDSGAQIASLKARPNERILASVSTSSGQRQSNKNKDLTKVQPIDPSTHHLETNTLISAATDSDLPMVSRRKLDTSDIQRKGSNNGGHNVTTVVVHKDDESASKKEFPEEEADSASVFQLMRNRGRRNSEPAVGGCFIRHLQTTQLSDMFTFQQRNSADGEELRRSIQVNLPSNIVAEKDEEERETNDPTENDAAMATGLQYKFQLSSISEQEQDGDQNTISLSGHQNEAADKKKSSKFNLNSRKPGNFPGYRGRRNSDGDVLSYSYAKKLNETKNNSWRSHLSVSKYVINRNNFGGVTGSTDTWETLRKCRYLRACDIPEMTEPSEVTEFVFGPDKNDTSTNTTAK